MDSLLHNLFTGILVCYTQKLLILFLVIDAGLMWYVCVAVFLSSAFGRWTNSLVRSNRFGTSLKRNDTNNTFHEEKNFSTHSKSTF